MHKIWANANAYCALNDDARAAYPVRTASCGNARNTEAYPVKPTMKIEAALGLASRPIIEPDDSQSNVTENYWPSERLEIDQSGNSMT